MELWFSESIGGSVMPRERKAGAITDQFSLFLMWRAVGMHAFEQ